MTIKVATPDHGERSFERADDWRRGLDGGLWISHDGIGVAEFAKGAWLFVYKTKDEPQGSRTWRSLDDVPTSVRVKDEDGDTWEYRDGGWKWRSHSNGKWYDRNDYDAGLDLFTEVLDV